MKKKTLLLMCMLMLITGCGKNPTPKNGEDALVTFKNGDVITVDEVYTDLKEKYGISLLIPKIYQNVLEKEFKTKVNDAKDKAKSTIEAYEEAYGGKEALLSALNQYGYADIEEFEDQTYLSYLEETAVLEYAKTLVEEKDIKSYYKDSVYGDVKIKHILITPEVKDDASEEAIKKAEDKAKAQVNDIIEVLKKAKDKNKEFDNLVKKYSSDDDTKEKNGDLGYINYGTLSSSYDELVKAALELKNGEFSTKVITTELGYHVIYRVDQKEKAKLDDVKNDIIETLAEKSVEEDTTMVGKAMQYYCKKNDVKINDDFLKSKYAQYVQSSLTEKTTEQEN